MSTRFAICLGGFTYCENSVEHHHIVSLNLGVLFQVSLYKVFGISCPPLTCIIKVREVLALAPESLNCPIGRPVQQHLPNRQACTTASMLQLKMFWAHLHIVMRAPARQSKSQRLKELKFAPRTFKADSKRPSQSLPARASTHVGRVRRCRPGECIVLRPLLQKQTEISARLARKEHEG